MGVFQDKKLEELDWMTQITETIDSDLNTTLAKLPDRTEVTVAHIMAGNNGYMSCSARDVLGKFIPETCGGFNNLFWDEERLLYKCFKFETDGEVEMDLRRDCLSGKISLVKVVQSLSDEELLPLMGTKGIDSIGRGKDYDETHLARMNEILDLLGECGDDMRGRSTKNKIIAIKNRLKTIFKTNEWRIRDMTLANKISLWIKGYIGDGNLACLTNLCKLKVMTHTNMPIYSVKEEV